MTTQIHRPRSQRQIQKAQRRERKVLAEAILKSMPKPKPAGPLHPFAEEDMWGGRGLK